MTTSIAFVPANPPQCTRTCNKIYEFHSPAISLALYSPPIKDMTLVHKVCVHGFSCGVEVYSSLQVEPTENLQATLRRAVFDVLPKLVNEAEAERKTLEVIKIN